MNRDTECKIIWEINSKGNKISNDMCYGRLKIANGITMCYLNLIAKDNTELTLGTYDEFEDAVRDAENFNMILAHVFSLGRLEQHMD